MDALDDHGSGRHQRAVVFVTDAGFLVPTVFAAEQASRQPSVAALADVFILLVDLPPDLAPALEREFASAGLIFRTLSSDLFKTSDSVFFNKTHVSRTTLGRFALHEVLPDHYEHVVYIDGDVQLTGDLGALLTHDVKPGFIAAANEFFWLLEGNSGAFWRRHRAYIEGLGITDASDYFNAGVLAFRMDTWREMAPKALAYFEAFSERCLYHDQSALNAVFLGRREILSPVYNFGTEFAKLGRPVAYRPRIVHFTGAGKPWYFVDPPWSGRFIPAYDAFLAGHPILKPFARRPDEAALSAIYKASRRSRTRSRFLTPWRRLWRRARFNAYLERTPFDVR